MNFSSSYSKSSLNFLIIYLWVFYFGCRDLNVVWVLLKMLGAAWLFCPWFDASKFSSTKMLYSSILSNLIIIYFFPPRPSYLICPFLLSSYESLLLLYLFVQTSKFFLNSKNYLSLLYRWRNELISEDIFYWSYSVWFEVKNYYESLFIFILLIGCL